MNWLSICALGGAVAFSTQTLVGTALSQPAMSPSASARRQLSDCMSKRMLASRTLSYYEAEKICKEQLKARGDALTASNEAKPANAR